MRSAALHLALAGIAALFAGCASHRDQGGPMAGSAPELVNRFEAAAAIGEIATRDQALADVAWLGAQAGDGRAVLKCLKAMSAPPMRDQAAYQCSARLADGGWVQEGVAVAQTIAEPGLRDRALSKIAKSSPYPAAPQ